MTFRKWVYSGLGSKREQLKKGGSKMEQKQKFMDLVNKEKVLDTFGCGKLADIAYSVFERVEDGTKKEEADEAIMHALDDELIYCADQWEVIAAYSTPSEPMSISEACELFFDDLMICID